MIRLLISVTKKTQ